jgi:hypothetical protein
MAIPNSIDNPPATQAHFLPEGVDHPISAYGEIAASFGLPLWVMVVPGTSKVMFENGGVERLVRLVRDYLDASDSQRSNVEGMAAGLAEINRGRTTEVANG